MALYVFQRSWETFVSVYVFDRSRDQLEVYLRARKTKRGYITEITWTIHKLVLVWDTFELVPYCVIGWCEESVYSGDAPKVKIPYLREEISRNIGGGATSLEGKHCNYIFNWHNNEQETKKKRKKKKKRQNAKSGELTERIELGKVKEQLEMNLLLDWITQTIKLSNWLGKSI